jgi:hypothetical protein
MGTDIGHVVSFYIYTQHQQSVGRYLCVLHLCSVKEDGVLGIEIRISERTFSVPAYQVYEIKFDAVTDGRGLGIPRWQPIAPSTGSQKRDFTSERRRS